MTENELKLITELEALHALSWASGMMAICPDGDHRLVLYTEGGGAWLTIDDTFGLNRSVKAAHCTHAPCDALTGWLVGELSNVAELRYRAEPRGFSIEINHPKNKAAAIIECGETMLEALLRAFKAKLEAEYVRVSTLEGNHD